MGTNCCYQSNNVQLENVYQHAYLADYAPAPWPMDQDLENQIKLSRIYNPSLQLTPLKHKVYNRWYWGHWVDGRPIDKGILYNKLAKDTIYYEGQFEGQPHGTGRVVFNGGQWEYNGEICRGKADGRGKLFNRKQGFQYSGQWKSSKALKGVLTLFNNCGTISDKLTEIHKQIRGNIVIQIENQRQHDKCVIKYPDGKVYRGQINKLRFFPEGSGELIFLNKNKYVGQWSDGQMHGQGRFQWQDGSFYDGQYRYGRKYGQGKFKFSSGNIYEGFWKDGKQHGRGILFDKSRNIIKNGQWKQGNFQQDQQ